MTPVGAARTDSPWPDVEVWWVDLRQAAAASAARHQALLDASETRRAAAFVFDDDRRQFVAAHGVVRELLGARLDIDPAAVEFTVGERGKPHLKWPRSWHFSLSHAGGAALVALSGHCEVGIDLEPERDLAELDDLAGHQLNGREQSELIALPRRGRQSRFFAAWTRKEACLKAVGTGLWVDAAQVDVGTTNVSTDTRVGGEPVRVASLAIGAGWHAALARRR